MAEITPEDAASLLNDRRNYGNRLRGEAPEGSPTPVVEYRPMHSNGRTAGAVEVPEALRVIMGAAAHFDSGTNVAREFGVSPKVVYDAKKGVTGSTNYDPELKDKVDAASGNKRKELKDVALERLANMFDKVITDTALEGIASVEKAVVIAQGIASIAERVSEKHIGGGVAVIIHAPRVKDESEYESIEVLATEVKRTDS